jgi:hypothetical protein
VNLQDVPSVIGFHACKKQFAEDLEAGKLAVVAWQASANKYDWLGDGIYFWENGYRRAVEWGREFVDGDCSIIEAEINLGKCFDLTNSGYIDLLQEVHAGVVELYKAEGWRLPENVDISAKRGTRRQVLRILDRVNVFLYSMLAGTPFRRDQSRQLRYLDSLVINQFLNLMENGVGEDRIFFQTVRCPFEEGELLFLVQ